MGIQCIIRSAAALFYQPEIGFTGFEKYLSEIVDTYIHQNTSEIVDPLDILKKIDALTEKRNTLLYELETQIKVSNATTFIEII